MLKGATLIETIVSMTLIGLIMTITLTCLFTINKDTVKPLAHFMVKKSINSAVENDNTEFSPFTIIRNLEKYGNSDNLFILEVKAVDVEGKTITSARRIVTEYEIYKTNVSENYE